MPAKSLITTFLGLFLGGLLPAPVCALDRVYPDKWEWAFFQQEEIEKLRSKGRQKPGSDFWQLGSGSIVVRSNVSAGLAAECYVHVKQALPQLTRPLLPPSSTRPSTIRFVVTIHGTERSLIEAAPDAYTSEGFSHLTLSDDGVAVAEIHLLSDWDIHPGAANNLAECVDVGILQRHLARMILQMWQPKQPFPPFFAEGYTSYYEVFDVHEKQPAIPGSSRALFKRAFVEAIVDQKTFRPSLAGLLQLDAKAFERSEELNGALANHFIQFVMAKEERRKFLHQALAHLKDGGRIRPESIASIEQEWHRHLYRTLSRSQLVLYTDYPTKAGVPGAASVSKISNYGNRPSLFLIPSKGGVHDLAWFGDGAVRFLRCDAEGRKIGEFSPSFAKDARGILGATRLPGDRGYAFGYSHDNAHGDGATEFWVAGVDMDGGEIFNTRIFGDQSLKVEKSKGGPGGAGTARMVYNEQAGHIGFYLAHNMLWGDGVRHQAGFVGFISPKGKRLPGGNGWFYSHNFDQRMIVAGGDFYTLAHGDAYPRALGFARWSGSGGKKVADTTYHTIPGESGDNTTKCQTGGLVALSGGRFAVVFATANEREGHDVCVKILDASGETTKERWLTEHEEGGQGAYPRIARHGDHIFVAWHDSSDSRGLQQIVLDRSLETVVPRTTSRDVKLSPYDDLHNLDNGAIVWAVPQGRNKIRVYRIDQPEVLEEALVKRNAAGGEG